MGVAEIRKVDIVSGVLPEEQKMREFESVPKMLKRIKVLRGKSRRRKEVGGEVGNPGEFSLFSLNERIKGLYKGEKGKEEEGVGRGYERGSICY